MFKFFYSMKSAADQPPTARPTSGDPFAYPEIASMDLEMLADLPPEQLRECRESQRDERRTPPPGLRSMTQSWSVLRKSGGRFRVTRAKTKEFGAFGDSTEVPKTRAGGLKAFHALGWAER